MRPLARSRVLPSPEPAVSHAAHHVIRTVATASLLVLAAGTTTAGCGAATSRAAGDGPTTVAPSAAPVASGSSSTPTSGANVGAQPVVHIKDFAISSPSAPVHPGEQLLVVNDDAAPHTYDDVNGAFQSGTIPGHSRKTVTAPAAGTYQVRCDFHGAMHGTLTVG